jgi:DNA-directed RNA polymerase subunit beta
VLVATALTHCGPLGELGRVGRRNMNQRLDLDIPQNNTFLLPRDVLAATDHLIGMKFGTGILDDDDMNHLKNKRIRSVADLLVRKPH